MKRFSTPIASRSTAAEAILLFAATSVAFSASLVGAQATTTPVRDGIGPASIDGAIHEALLEYGTVEALAVQLNAADHDDHTVLAKAFRISTEQGNIAEAMAAARALAAGAPGDVATLCALADAQERCGFVDDAARTLVAAAAATPDLATRSRLEMRTATLALDAGDTAEAVRLLDEVVRRDPSMAASAGVIAYFGGQFDVANRHLMAAGDRTPATLKLLAGNAALRAQRPIEADLAFQAALSGLKHESDRRYAIERMIAARRAAGTLPQLADAWLEDDDLPSERLPGLASVLRETGRAKELLAWWRQKVAQPGQTSVLLAPQITSEVIGAAQDAGLSDEVESIALDLLRREQVGPSQWLSTVVSILLNHGKAGDADALLAEQVTSAADHPAQLEALGRLARSFGRDMAASSAARAMRALGGGNAIRGLLLEASILLRAGNTTAGVALLHEAGRAAIKHHVAVLDVATAFETANLEVDAVRLLQTSAQNVPDEAVLERLSSLLVQQRRNAEAIPILRSLRKSGTTAAVRGQAGRLILDLAVADRALDALISEMHEVIDAGDGSDADLVLLVDAYTRAGNPTAAASVIQNSKLLDERTRLNRLAVLYQRSGDLTRTSEVLRQLVAVEPANAVRTLERIASVELSRKRPREASAAIAEIASRAGDRSASFAELMGGVHDRLNNPARAATYYRRALAANPGNADGWLLWATAMSKANHTKQAIGRLQVLAGEATSENVFAIAVDGLLNLKAPRAALLAARRDALCRVAASPQSATLLHLIGDLSDELRDSDGVIRALDASVAMNREERPQVLRELMENASGKGLIEEATACGRSMLALGDDFPPQLFLQLGEQLLVAGLPAEASRAFAKAIQISSVEIESPRAAALLERYGHPSAALRLLTPLADRLPNDLPLRTSIARLSELAGRPAAAFEAYIASLTLADRQISSLSMESRPNRYVVAPPMPDLARLIDGATAVARTGPQQERLLQELENQLRERISLTPASAEPSRELERLLAHSRRACFAFGRPEAADLIDQLVIDRWPDRIAIQKAALEARSQAGMYAQALRFAAAHPLAGPVRKPLSTTVPTTSASGATAVDAALMLPQMIMYGRSEEARRVLDALSVAMPERINESVPTLIAAAVALGRDDVATNWTAAWARSIREPAQTPTTVAATSSGRPASMVTQELRNLIISVWRVLPTSARHVVVKRSIELSDEASARSDSTTANLIALQLAAAEGVPFPGQVERALQIVREWRPTSANQYSRLPEVASLIHLLPTARRAEFLGAAIELCPVELRLAILQQIVAQAGDPFDSATASAIVGIASALPDRQNLIWSNWFESDRQIEVLAALADATRRSVAERGSETDEVAFAVAAAAALARSSSERADTVALSAIEVLTAPSLDVATTRLNTSAATLPAPRTRAVVPPEMTRTACVRLAIKSLSAGARQRLLDSTGAKNQGAPSTARWLTVRAALFDATGRRGEALDPIRRAYALNPDDPFVWEAYVDRLVADGRHAELVETFARPPAPFAPALRVPLTNALQQLFRFHEIPLERKGAGASTLTPYASLDFMTARAVNDVASLAEAMRTLLERVRADSGARPVIVEALEGGLVGMIEEATPNSGLLSDLSRWPGSIDDLYATIRLASTGTLLAVELSNLIERGAREPTAVAPIVETLSSRAAASAITANDRLVLQSLCAVPGLKLPPLLIAELWTPVVAGPTDEEDYLRLADALRAQGDARAVGVERWAAARSRVSSNPGRATSFSRPPPPSPSLPFYAIDDRAIAWLESQADAGHADAGEQSLRVLRQTGRASALQTRAAMLWARLAAERGDLEGFRTRIDAALEGLASLRLSRTSEVDWYGALPKVFRDGNRRDAVAQALQDAIEHAAARWPSDQSWTRGLITLGRWSLDAGDGARAERLLEAAAALADRQGAGEHQLWIADLSRMLGQADRAWMIERRLLEERCLPATRIAPLLRHIEAAGSSEEARRLAIDAARYCGEPNLRRMARGTGVP